MNHENTWNINNPYSPKYTFADYAVIVITTVGFSALVLTVISAIWLWASTVNF